MPVVLELSVPVDATVQQTWDAAVAWERQQSWMIGTKVRTTSGTGRGTGDRLEAVTRLGPLVLRDPMTIVVWEPPYRCEVRHDGRVLRGRGVFSVRPRAEQAEFVWREELDLPLGVVGRVGWLFVRPFAVFGVALSLRRFARHVPASAQRL